jgi:hypothetical protein
MAQSSYFCRELLPPARACYERELGRLGRPNSRGWSFTRCPFHRSKSGKSFSVNVQTGAFHCFGCDSRGGDLIDFLRKLHGYSFKSAAKLLGVWREDLTREERRELDERTAKVRYEREQAEQAKAIERARLTALRDEIHTTGAIYREANDRLSELRRGASEAYEGEQEHCWAVLALALDDLRLSEQEYMQVCGLGDNAA